jgi:hypothetical protein
MLAARGETLRVWGNLQLADPVPGVIVELYAVAPVTVRRPSTSMYGGGGEPGAYPDVLTTYRAGSQSMMTVVSVARDIAPATLTGTLTRPDGTTSNVTLTISQVTLPSIAPRVWAYYDPRELEWAGLGHGTVAVPSDQERWCIATFRAHGVLLSPDMKVEAWNARKPLFEGFPFVPALLENGSDAASWIAATQGTGQVPFAIPIDEPHSAADRAKVKALATEARAAGAGPGKFLFAVTDERRAEYGDLVDLYITLRAKRADTFTRWTYNGAPPHAGSMVADAELPGPRTWGWIAHRWNIPIWYVWDALYWHDRHNRKGGPLPGKPLDVTTDATSFDDGEDHGNLDGVLAFPGDAKTPCRPSVRLTELARGQEDRQLIELAAACDAAATDALVAKQVPTALGDAPDSGTPSWPTDEASWERARRDLIAIAARCAK